MNGVGLENVWCGVARRGRRPLLRLHALLTLCSCIAAIASLMILCAAQNDAAMSAVQLRDKDRQTPLTMIIVS